MPPGAGGAGGPFPSGVARAGARRWTTGNLGEICPRILDADGFDPYPVGAYSGARAPRCCHLVHARLGCTVAVPAPVALPVFTP